MKRSFVQCVVCAALFFPAGPVTAQDSGMPFLRIGVNAAGLALGDAYVAQSRGAFATFWNPAGLSAASSNAVAVSHHRWVGDVRTYSLASRFRMGEQGGLGLFATTTDANDSGLPGGLEDSDVLFGAQFVTVGAAYGRSFGPLRAGVSAKYLTERFDAYAAYGFALDFGVQADLYRGALRLGASLNNVGRVNDVRERTASLPRLIRVGAAVFPFRVLASQDGEALLSAYFTGQISHVLTDDPDIDDAQEPTQFHAGIAAEVLELITLRAGYISGDELRTFSLGAGIAYGDFIVDYAFIPFEAGLSSGHVLTAVYGW